MNKDMNWSDYFEEVTGGEIRIKGSRIAIDTIVEQYNSGSTPEEMAGTYQSISLAQIYVTIAYYLSNRAQVDAYIEEGYRIIDEFIRNQDKNPALVRLKKLKDEKLSIPAGVMA